MKVLLAAILLMTVNTAWAAGIGTVSESKGNSCSIERNKQKLGGDKGASIESNDTYVTAGCQANLTFQDDTKVKVTENSRLLIDDFVYDPKKSDAGKLAMKVGLGTVRYVSGQIAKNNPQQVAIQTPSATIAVRGTDFSMTVDEAGQSLVVLLPSCKDEKDIKQYELQENHCKTGQISVSTLSGTVVLDQPFHGTYVIAPTQAPTQPRVINTIESKINNTLILVKPIEIQRALHESQKGKNDKDKEQLELEAQLAFAKAQKAKEEAQAAELMKLRGSSAGPGCDSAARICVRWDNPDSPDLTMRGRGTAYRINQDNVAEVKTSGFDSNTFISITHNDSPASLVIGDPSTILNTVVIKQSVGIAKVVSK